MAKGATCPLLGKACIEDRCKFWIHLRGTNKNTGAEVDDAGCSIAFLPMLLIENAAMARQTGAAVESLRNTTVKAEDATRRTMMAGFSMLADPRQGELPLIENGNGT